MTKMIKDSNMTYKLNRHDIDKIASEVVTILSNSRSSSQSRFVVRLVMEELLLKYQEKYGNEPMVELIHAKRFGRKNIILKIYCDSYNPIDNVSEEDVLLERIFQSLGYVPTWKYRNCCNELCFPVKIESAIPSWVATLIACGLGIICGWASRLFPLKTISMMSETLLNPILSAVMGFLGAVSALMIFLSIIYAIVSMENLATLSRIGKKMLNIILLSILISAVTIFLLSDLLFPVSHSGGGRFEFGTLWIMILDIIPDSFIDPFNNGNALQILFLSVVIGFLMLRSIGKIGPVVDVINGLYQVVQDMMELVIKTLPVVVFISLFNLFSGVTVVELNAIYKYPLLQMIISFCWLTAVFFLVCVKHKVKPIVLFKKLMPAFIIAISTASSNAALITSMETCEKDLGINSKLVKLGIPLSHSINKTHALFLLMTGTMCMAEVFSVNISWTSLIMMVLMATLLGIAAPSVPGGGVSVFTLLLSIYGIPMEALSIIISLDVICDRIYTSATVSTCQLNLIQVADGLNELNKEILREPGIYSRGTD